MWLKCMVHTCEEVHDTQVNELHGTHVNKVCGTHTSRKYTVHIHEQSVWYRHVNIVQGTHLWTKCLVHTWEWTTHMKIHQCVQWICANNRNTHSTFSRLHVDCIFFFIISPFCDIRCALEGQQERSVAKASCFLSLVTLVTRTHWTHMVEGENQNLKVVLILIVCLPPLHNT